MSYILWFDEDDESSKEKYGQLQVIRKAQHYINNPNIKVYLSNRKGKKYAIYDPNNKNLIHFGQFNPPMQDNTKHKDDKNRQNYLLRTSHIKCDWKNNPYSANHLSINLLW